MSSGRALVAALWTERVARRFRRADPHVVIELVSIAEHDGRWVAHGTELSPDDVLRALARAPDAPSIVAQAIRWCVAWGEGQACAWIDDDDDEIVWWGAFHPKGDHEYDVRQSIASFRATGRPTAVESVPADVLAQVAEAVARHDVPSRPREQQLVLAIRAGDAARALALVAEGVDPCAYDRRGEPVLAIAIAARRTDVALALLRAGADPARCESGLDGLLVAAIAIGGWELASELLDRGARPRHDQTLVSAIAVGAPIPLLDRLRRLGPTPTPTRGEWRHHAVTTRIASEPAIAAWVRANVGEIPAPPPPRAIAAPARPQPDLRLHDAVARGDVGTVRTLLASGIAPGARDWNGRTPLMRAVDAPPAAQAETVAALLAGGAKHSDADAFGATALVKAVRRGAHAVVRALLAGGAAVDAWDDGAPALSWAAGNGDHEMVAILLGAGARTDRRDRRGRTALDHALHAKSDACAALLRAP